MNSILYEDNHLLVVYKKANMPVQLDDSKDLDLLTYLKDYLKNKYNKSGNVYLGLVHRLDRPVSGVMVFAKTSKSASRLSEQIRNKEFKKTYLAVVEGIPLKEGKFVDKLLKDEKTNIVKIDNKGKEAILSYKLLGTKDNLSLVEIDLETGRSHQIRVQFSSRGYPLYGDMKYNNNVKDDIALFSESITLLHPITKESMTFKSLPPDKYPWNIFKEYL